MSGRHAQTKKTLNKKSAIPNCLTIYPHFSDEKYVGNRRSIRIHLFQDADNSHFWLEHPEFSNKVDVAEIEIPNHGFGELANINKIFDGGLFTNLNRKIGVEHNDSTNRFIPPS